MTIKQQKFGEIPMFELTSFTLYELNRVGLQTLMLGDNAIRYEDRYTVSNINYTDNSRDYIANMQAKYGLYKDNIIDLKEDVVYAREDGLNFETSRVIYNKNSSIATADSDYVSYQGENVIQGSFVKYNNSLNRVKSKNVTATYQLKER